jgi:hypothetical protein
MLSLFAGAAHAADEATLLVNLSSSSECADKPSMAWLSKGRTLLYQADVSPNGTVEFHTRSGEYNLVVTGESGCFVEKRIAVKAHETKEVGLRLDRTERAQTEGAKK